MAVNIRIQSPDSPQCRTGSRGARPPLMVTRSSAISTVAPRARATPSADRASSHRDGFVILVSSGPASRAAAVTRIITLLLAGARTVPSIEEG